MKLQVKQLDTATANTIAVALETYADCIGQLGDIAANKYLELAATFRHAIVLLCTEGYDAPQDDVQVLGKQEKGGESWS